ncbi:MAG TPA: DNA polymerase III subunit gamma/tau, partial [Beijerinckiaceae bacterium]|nr:DNA polymerase III subunit gamma/tau [Beijerinckiaceae bacterium]
PTSAGASRGAAAAQRQEPAAEPRFRPTCLEDLVALAQSQRDIQLKIALERDVRLVKFEEGSLEFALAPGASPQLAQTLSRRLQEWTGVRWLVAISSQSGAPSLKEQAKEQERERLVDVSANPLVRAVLERFPGAEIVSVRTPDSVEEPKMAAATRSDVGDDVIYRDAGESDDE